MVITDTSAVNSNIYQLHISLKGPKPKIWRRIQVSENLTFWDLHVAIQDVMPWEDYHLHQFEIKKPGSGMPDVIGTPDEAMGVGVDERQSKLKDYFLRPKDKGTYLYDFGIGWLHEVVLEMILPAVAGVKYPQCTAGKHPCFPEDAVGDAEEVEFDHKTVKFRDPDEHWNSWFNNPNAAL